MKVVLKRHIREFKQRRFWATHVNRKWALFAGILGQVLSPNLQAIAKAKTLDNTHLVAYEQALLFGRAKQASREHASEGASPLARAFRETRFARPNRRACSQANYAFKKRKYLTSGWRASLKNHVFA